MIDTPGQRRVAAGLRGVEAGGARDQELDHVGLTLFGGGVQRADQQLTLGVHVGAMLERRLGDPGVARVGCRMQGREAALVRWP